MGDAVSGHGVQHALHVVASFLVADVPLEITLQRIADLTKDALPPARSVGITLVDSHGKSSTAVCTDELAPSVDAGQYRDDTGPCLDALREATVIRVDEVAEHRDRWPSFVADAQAHGVRSTLSLPLVVGDAPAFGAMNIYATEPAAFGEDHVDDASLLATYASAVLANARAYWEAIELAAGLREAMKSRATIEQAKGKIMAANECTADEAFNIMVLASQRENIKLRDIAARIVEGTATF